MTTLFVILAALVLAPPLGQALRWRDQVKAKRVAEEHRITPHEYLAGVEERLVLSEPWPTRQTPTDLAVAYEAPAVAGSGQPPSDHAPAMLTGPGGLSGAAPSPQPPDHFSIAAQVWAHQQLDHIKRLLSDPIGTAWNTPTGEWDVTLLGLSVPDSPASLSLFSDVT